MNEEKEKSYFFITITTFDRQPILIEHAALIKNAFLGSKSKFKYDMVAIIINSDHIHFIIYPEIRKEVSKIISETKRYFTSKLNKISNKYREGTWQGGYFEKELGDKDELYRHIDYIHYDSLRHNNIAPKDWEYSSFRKFVKLNFYDENWENQGDKRKVVELNCEYDKL